MKRTEKESWRRKGWLDGYQYLTITKGDVPDAPEMTGNLVCAVYIADDESGYKCFLDQQRAMLVDNVSILSWSPMDEPIVAPVYRFYMKKHGLEMVFDAKGRALPPESFIQWEKGFTDCIKAWWAEVPNGTSLYSAASLDWIQKKYK